MKNNKLFCKCVMTEFSFNHRQLLLLLFFGLLLLIGGCGLEIIKNREKNIENITTEDKILIYKYRGISGGVLYISAVGEDKNNVTMLNQNGVVWKTTLQIGEGGDRHEAYTGAMYISRTLHVTWRTEDAEGRKGYNGRDGLMNGYEGGSILGDYTVPLSTRIPDAVLDYIRKNGGALRIKIRLADHGVLIGWDVEEWYTEKYGRGLRNVMPGGDFREAQIENGKVVERGWMIMPDGAKVETDY